MAAIVVDNMALQQFRNCFMQGYYRIIRGLVPRDERPRTPLLFGQAVHLALEHYYKGATPEATIKVFEDYFRPHETMEDDLRTMETGRSLLRAYFKQVRDEFEVVEVERPFRVTLAEDDHGEPLVEYAGRLDLVIRWSSTGRLRIMEHKTTSRLGRFIQDPNNQGMGYMWGAAKLYPDEEVEAIVFNFLGVYKTGGKRPSRYEEGTAFKRVPAYYSKQRLIQWQLHTVALLHDITTAQERGIFWTNTVSCSLYNGECPYIPLCVAETEKERDTLIEEAYEHSPWTPGAETISFGGEI